MADEKENPNPDEAVDPPEQQGGGGEALDSMEEASRTVDPPEQQGGGG